MEKDQNSHSHATVQSNADVVSQNAGGASLPAPAYSGGVQADGAQSTTAGNGDKALPETLGPAQEGPISAQGEGDAHAFSPNDVRQGSIGDCYFLASLMAVAHTTPDLLKKAITKNNDGTYTVKLYITKETGRWFWKGEKLVAQNVIIYPTFPLEADGTDTANPDANSVPAHAWTASTDESELWVRLIEKAYALLIGSYAEIGNGGLGADALETLTGEKYTHKVFGSTKKVKRKIIEMVEDNTPVVVDSINIDNASEKATDFARDNSIVQPHAYAVISANDSTITVRNPHGQRNTAEGITGARNVQPSMTWDMFFELFTQYSDKN